MVCKDHGCIGFAFAFECVIAKNLKTPKLSPMADSAITRGGIGGLGSLVYICVQNSVPPRKEQGLELPKIYKYLLYIQFDYFQVGSDINLIL